MAPILDSAYFPPVDDCLRGEQLLISWKVAFSAISGSSPSGKDHESAIRKFLADPDVLTLLSNPFNAYPPPSAATKANFDTRTSAINVTPSKNALYDIKEVKEDALWLSKLVQIDEVSALRIAIEECQYRASAQLLGPFSEEELASIRGSAGESRYSNPIPVALLSRGADAETLKKDFDKKESRQNRILQTYLSGRRNVIKCTEQLVQACFSASESQSENGKSQVPHDAESWVVECGRAVVSHMRLNRSDEFILSGIKFVEGRIASIQNGSGWLINDECSDSVEVEWIQNQIVEATHSMEIIWHFLLHVLSFPSSQVALGWFQLQRTFGFFNSFSMDEPSIQVLVLPLQAISTIISVAMIDLANCLELLSNIRLEEQVSAKVAVDKPYLLNSETIVNIHSIISDAADQAFATAGPAVFAWGVVLQAMNERVGEIQEVSRFERQASHDTELTLAPDLYSNVMEQLVDSSPEDFIDSLALRAVNSCGVFETISALSLHLGCNSDAFFSQGVGSQMRMLLLDVIKSSTRIGYIPEIVQGSLSALNAGQTYWDNIDSKPLPRIDDPVAAFLDDEILVQQVLVNAKSRYPYETLPFLKLIRSIAAGPHSGNSVIRILDDMSVFTYVLPPDFADYETTLEEDNNNSIVLTRDIQLFMPRSGAARYQSAPSSSQALLKADSDFCIRAGTLGRIVSESGPRVAFWFHQYSGLKYMGKLLETFLAGSDWVDATTTMSADRESVCEIIEIFAALLLGINTSSNSNSKEEIEQIFKESSSGLSRNRDITTVIFDIFEEELQVKSSFSGSNISLDVLVSCMHFVHAITPNFPGRVWPLMSRTGLLGVGGGRLSTIVESIELLSGRYELLISSCRLYESLVDDIVINAIQRKRGDKSPGRFKGNEDVAIGIPSKAVSSILLSFTRYLMDVLESSRDWKFTSQDDRRCISQIIGRTFNKLLQYAYGVDSPIQFPNSDEDVPGYTSFLKPSLATRKDRPLKLTEPLMLSASHLIETYLAAGTASTGFQPMLCSYFDGLETAESTTFTARLSLWTQQVNTILVLTNTLLQVSALLEMSSSNLARQVFEASSLIVRLYARNDTYQTSVISLLGSLLLIFSNQTSEPPSLLGNLGSPTATNFLRVVADLDKPLIRDEVVASTWHFLSIIVSSRQQWFANYLLTGKTKRDAVKSKADGKEAASSPRTLLTTALSRLSSIRELPSYETLAMLEFVALAQNFWPYTVTDSINYQTFINAIAIYVGTLKPLQPTSDLSDCVKACHQTRIAAYIAEIFAMHMFHSRQMGTDSQAKEILSNLDYFERWAIAPPKGQGYNASLHSHLNQNYEARYPGCVLRDLKRTTLEYRQLGKEYFYNVPVAGKMLEGEEAWNGKKNDGIRAELENANVNLSLVDAQIALFNSWRFLAVELSATKLASGELEKMFARIVVKCLQENRESQPPEEIFSRLSLVRVDFAIVLTQRLMQARSSAIDKKFLPEVWKTIYVLREKFDQPIRGSDTQYYRSLLKLLFLAARISAETTTGSTVGDKKDLMRATQNADLIATIIDVLKFVVSMGIREVAASIHEDAAKSSPEDLSLITGILQSCLRIPGIELYHQQIVSLMMDNRSAEVAMSLFSFSDTLAIDGDPIYGELSILFLLELSSIPLMGEQLAINGILSHIATANITSYLRKTGVNSLAESAGLQRCYSIWARGILPLLLNLLDAVQASMAVEVSLFLAQFQTLVTQSEQAFDAPETKRIMPRGQAKYITLTICTEVHSMALLSFILGELRENLRGTVEIPELKWDAASVLENVEFWLGSRALLRERILPMGEREVELARTKVGGTFSLLETRVVAEMTGIRDVLSRKENN